MFFAFDPKFTMFFLPKALWRCSRHRPLRLAMFTLHLDGTVIKGEDFVLHDALHVGPLDIASSIGRCPSAAGLVFGSSFFLGEKVVQIRLWST